MQPKTIGIIGGAGPQAGVSLLQRLIVSAQRDYGCWRDSDFPRTILLSIPFREMLREELDQQSIRNELEAGIDQLQQAGAGVMVIACNTLYGFLGQVDEQVISLPQLVTAQVASALVLCTSRARQMQVYPAQWDYLMPADQCRLDCAIDELLKGREPIEILQQIIAEQPSPTIVLGCSELSLIVSKLQVAGKRLIDPIELAVERLLEISFEARRKVA